MVPERATGFARYRQVLWLLTKRDLKVRYSTSVLGYLWSVLDPLLMSGIYYFVFTKVFHRDVGEEPYIVFLLSGLLAWQWFNGSVSDSTKAFLSDAKLVRSTKIPRSVWINRVVASKGIEFLFSIPVLAFFAIATHAQLHWQVVLFPIAVVLQTVLITGISLIIAPLVVFFRDLERATRLILRFLFYASPIVYSTKSLPKDVGHIFAFNPLSGIFGIYRAAFFPNQLIKYEAVVGAIMCFVILGIGMLVFRLCERAVLKEI
ncbi:sugar ABC transporter [Frondihabitans sp. PAMC 28766]|nr:ABC transporter permease [Frondihabitans sp. PAMC 28766]AMM22315.1 sugar ABC transporter [Frondihabitans sp. PAMC 28766]